MTLDDPWLLVRAWLLAPALVVLASAGLGLLVARLSGLRLGALTIPVGFLSGIAVVTVVLQVRLTVGGPAVIALAVPALAGLALGARGLRRDDRPPRAVLTPWLWAAGGGLATYALFMAPLAGSGRSGVVGYVLNNDPAVHLASIDLIRDYGPVGHTSLADSYHFVSGNFGSGYPIGSYVWPMFSSLFTATDPFHLWSPLIAVSAAMLALVGYDILRRLDAPPWLSGVAGAVVASSYLTYSYAMQGGAKEVAASLGVYASIAAFAAAEDREFDWRGLLPAVLCVSGGIAIFSVAELAWLGPAALAAIAVMIVRRLRRGPGVAATVRDLAITAGVFAIITVPSLVAGERFVRESGEEVLNDVGEAGNLLAPLKWIEAFGVWLTKDYRFPYTDSDVLTGIGIGIAAVLAIAGLGYALARRSAAVPISLIAGFAAIVLVVIRGRHGIYLDAKAYALLAPALGLASAAGVAALLRGKLPLRVLGAVAGLAVAVGVVASDLLVYSGAWVTPKERFGEMIQLDQRYAGKGPVLVNEREEYIKHMMRDVGPWMSWDSYQPDRGFRAGPVPASIPHVPDFDDYRLEFYNRFPLLFERKRPGGSRPPGNYEAIQETPHYRVWRRTGPTPRAHLALGNGDTIAGTAKLDCRSTDFRALRALAERDGKPLRVAWGERVVVRHDYQWRSRTATIPGPQPNFNYRLRGAADVPTFLAPGRWRAWLEGSFGPGQRLSLPPPRAKKVNPEDKVGEVRADLGIQDGFQQFGEVDVPTGRQLFQVLSLAKPWWQAGSKRYDLVGPIVFEPVDSTRRVADVDPRDARRLCGERLDWIEVG